MAKATRFGRQPAYEILKKERWHISLAAHEIGVSHQHLSKAVHGYYRPNDVVREKLPKLVNVPLDQLFTAESLKPYWFQPGSPR